MKFLKKRLGKLIKEERKKKGFKTQAQLAKGLNAQQATIARWESGVRSPSKSKRLALCKLLEVPSTFFDNEQLLLQATDEMDGRPSQNNLGPLLDSMDSLNKMIKGQAETILQQQELIKAQESGKREQSTTLTVEENELLGLYRIATRSDQTGVLKLLRSRTAEEITKAKKNS